MKLLDLFITSSIPVVKILLISVVGLYMALERVNILGQDARKHLNIVVFYVFTPSLIGSSLVETITYETLAKMWFMPINILLTFIIGSFFGWIVILITRPPSYLRGLLVGACAAGNLGNLLLIIIPAICKEKGSPFGDPKSCEKYGLGYVSLSMALGAVYIWTYVYNLMRMLTNRAKETESSSIESNYESCAVSLISSKEDEEDVSKVGIWDKFRQSLCSMAERINLRTIFAPSTVAAIIAMVIGLIRPIRKLLIGSTAPLHVIEDSVSLVGEGAIPALTLIIGGNLLRGLRSSGMKKSIVLCVIIARYVMLPITGVLIVRGAYWMGWVSSDPLYQFVLMLQFVVPPAMNLSTITQLFGSGESECSVILLWTYALASVSLTLWPTFFMWLVA